MRIHLVLMALVACCFLTKPPASAADRDSLLEQQRAAFRAVYAEVERGNWRPVEQHQKLLKNYILWPDLRATYLRAHLTDADHDEIDAFLNRYGVLKPARELRYRYALHLANEGRLSEYFSIYQQFYQDLEIANLDCLALQAEIDSGEAPRAVDRAIDLWLVGKSQADECDSVFDNLRDRNLLSANRYIERFRLAINAKRFSLARYLARSLEPRYLNEANEWLDAQRQPSQFAAAYLNYADTELTKRLFAYAIERIAVGDPAAAITHWQTLSTHFSFNEEQIDHISRHIALWAARMRLPKASEMLSSLSGPARDTEVRRWLARNNLLYQRWEGVIENIDSLPADEHGDSEWQYWKAVALDQLGKVADAAQIFGELATERDYYGFLSADHIGASYPLAGAPIPFDAILAEGLSRNPELSRARELFFVGLEGRGRSEWDAAVQLLTTDEQIQAALLANSWGWHSRAITTVAIAGNYDDLRVRYPLPWRTDFEKYASSAGVSDSWAYGIARSESLFMRDIRSSAGAIGLMQIMPETGRRTAREIHLPWSGQATLTESSSNIQLGTHYLAKMFIRFDNNRVLATAAYNAGPLRVEAWLPESGNLDARIWIENIPFNETRRYVRRVLTDEAIFHWRMTGQLKRISSDLPLVGAPQDDGKKIKAD